MGTIGVNSLLVDCMYYSKLIIVITRIQFRLVYRSSIKSGIIILFSNIAYCTKEFLKML